MIMVGAVEAGGAGVEGGTGGAEGVQEGFHGGFCGETMGWMRRV